MCGKGEKVVQETTAVLATEQARQTPPGARPNRKGLRLPAALSLSGRPLELCSNAESRQMAVALLDMSGEQNPAYRPAPF